SSAIFPALFTPARAKPAGRLVAMMSANNLPALGNFMARYSGNFSEGSNGKESWITASGFRLCGVTLDRYFLEQMFSPIVITGRMVTLVRSGNLSLLAALIVCGAAPAPATNSTHWAFQPL